MPPIRAISWRTYSLASKPSSSAGRGSVVVGFGCSQGVLVGTILMFRRLGIHFYLSLFHRCMTSQMLSKRLN